MFDVILKILYQRIKSLKRYLFIYKSTTKDLFLNFFNFNRSIIYTNGLLFKSVLIYSFSSFVLSYIIIFLPLNILSSIDGSVNILIFFVKIILIISLLALFYSIPIWFLKKKFLWNKIFLVLILAFSFYFPFDSFISLPTFLNQQDLNINFFLGGDKNLGFHPISQNFYLLLFNLVIGCMHLLIPQTIIPMFWLSKAFNIKWWIILIIISCFSIVPVDIIAYINPIILDFTHYINNIINTIL